LCCAALAPLPSSALLPMLQPHHHGAARRQSHNFDVFMSGRTKAATQHAPCRAEVRSCAADSRSALLGLRPPRDPRVVLGRQSANLHERWQPVWVVVWVRLPCLLSTWLGSRPGCSRNLPRLARVARVARVARLLPGHTTCNPGHGSRRHAWGTTPRHRHRPLCPVSIRPGRALLLPGCDGIPGIRLHWRVRRWRSIACRRAWHGLHTRDEARHPARHRRTRVWVSRRLLHHRVCPGREVRAGGELVLLHLRRVIAATHGPVHRRLGGGSGVGAAWVVAVRRHARRSSSILHIHPSGPSTQRPPKAAWLR